VSVFLQVFCAIFSAFIESLAIPNEFFYFGSPIFGLIALVPLYFALYRARSYREAALVTGLQVGATHLLSSFWLANFRDFAIFTLGGSALATAVEGAVAGWYLWPPFCADGKSLSASRPSPAFRAIFFASVWTFYEWTKCYGFLGYPWGTLSMTAATWHEIKQIAEFTGERGVTFLLALFNAVAAEGLLLGVGGFPGRRREPFAVAATQSSILNPVFRGRKSPPSARRFLRPPSFSARTA
jgi:apolipoprotein N-acyltransferase